MKRSSLLKSKFSNRHSSSHRAFTLIEMIVALGIFSIVAVVALGALTKIISANKKAQTLQSSITNLNFALDAMSREMRVGTNFNCIGGSNFSEGILSSSIACPNGPRLGDINSGNNSTIIAFNSSKTSTDGSLKPCNLIYVYRINYNSTNKSFDLEKAQQSTCEIYNTYTYNSITDPNVVITGYYVNVVTDVYPRATIRISGYTGTKEKEKTYFDVQTTVSARVQ